MTLDARESIQVVELALGRAWKFGRMAIMGCLIAATVGLGQLFNGYIHDSGFGTVPYQLKVSLGLVSQNFLPTRSRKLHPRPC